MSRSFAPLPWPLPVPVPLPLPLPLTIDGIGCVCVCDCAGSCERLFVGVEGVLLRVALGFALGFKELRLARPRVLRSDTAVFAAPVELATVGEVDVGDDAEPACCSTVCRPAKRLSVRVLLRS